LLLVVKLQQDSSSCMAQQASATQQQQQHVHVFSHCRLPSGFSLGRAALLNGSSAHQALLEHGPQALCELTARVSPVVQQHVHELTVVPPEDDPWRDMKLQLLAATGLGICHYLTAALPPATQQDSASGPSAAAGGQPPAQQLDAVLAAMALCLAAPADDGADASAPQQLLRPDVVAAVLQQLQQQQSANAAAGVVATAGMLPLREEDDADGAEPAADDGTMMASGAAATTGAAAWPALKQQLLQQWGKAACKQLLAALKADLASVRSALGALDGQHGAAWGGEASGGLAAVPTLHGACARCKAATGSKGAAAVRGVRWYLEGAAHVLEAWCRALKAARGGSGKKKGAGGSSGSGGKKKKARQ
jgi:hypothetical protein